MSLYIGDNDNTTFVALYYVTTRATNKQNICPRKVMSLPYFQSSQVLFITFKSKCNSKLKLGMKVHFTVQIRTFPGILYLNDPEHLRLELFCSSKCTYLAFSPFSISASVCIPSSIFWPYCSVYSKILFWFEITTTIQLLYMIFKALHDAMFLDFVKRFMCRYS